MPKEIHISILDADQTKIEKELEQLISLGIKHIHLDIGDTSFISSITFATKTIAVILEQDFIFDLHFMLNNSIKIIENMNLKNVACITIHYEIDHFTECLENLIKLKKSHSFEIGIALRPETMKIPDKILIKVDRLLIMTVKPGYGGQRFIEESDSKVDLFRTRFKGKIGVDGGINATTIIGVIVADYFVIGSYFYKSGDKKTCIKALNQLLNPN